MDIRDIPVLYRVNLHWRYHRDGQRPRWYSCDYAVLAPTAGDAMRRAAQQLFHAKVSDIHAYAKREFKSVVPLDVPKAGSTRDARVRHHRIGLVPKAVEISADDDEVEATEFRVVGDWTDEWRTTVGMK